MSPLAKPAFALAAALSLASCGPAPGAGAAVNVPEQTGDAPANDPSSKLCPQGMVFFQKATYQMGVPKEDEDAMPDDAPLHQVTVEAFCMAKNETTVSDYDSCVKAGDCTAPGATNNPECNTDVGRFARHPINCVDFMQAAHYCEKKGLRLPTEEEWEFAARGTAGRKYPWGAAELDTSRLNACDELCMHLIPNNGTMFQTPDGFAATAPVGSFPKGATPEGLQDMAGNVAEWTTSQACPTPGQACAEKKRPARGGGWDMWAFATAQGNFRGGYEYDPSERLSEIGFRCAKTPDAPR
jgi:formylglycine-generating enzyme required for sulfatase activity